MTLSEFSDSSKEQIGFILNFSDLVAAFLPDISITLPDPAADYGTQANHFVKGYNGSSLTVNGKALLGNKFSDVSATFTTTDDKAMEIGFETTVNIMMESTVSGSLTLCEKDEMEDPPTDISGEFSEDGETGE